MTIFLKENKKNYLIVSFILFALFALASYGDKKVYEDLKAADEKNNINAAIIN